LKLIHNDEHIDYVDSLEAACKGIENGRPSDKSYDCYENGYTCKAAYMAAGGAIEAVKAVCRDKNEESKDEGTSVDHAFAIVRPPGHHAHCNELAGFCFFNNVPIAARVAQNELGKKKVCIFDWDVHMGDGSADSLIEDDSILFISIHRWEDDRFYPGRGRGNPMRIGKGKGKGHTILFPVNTDGTRGEADKMISDTDYIYACETIFFPIIREFEPDLIIVSAGFDSALGDKLGGLGVTPMGYAWIT